ncbi:MAG: lysophospholipid acyltransferase family protein, partial [Verrucomicrobiales bacterium]|nr:lysophospholipid acyltransferase family protein [Verrucomicrobiales bacterium]
GEGGAVLLTAHMGNYDVAAPVFASRFKNRVHAVRAPERSPELQAHLARDRERLSSEHFTIQYNTSENFLGVDLANTINAGEIVALQGDRLISGLAPVTAEMFGSLVRLPKGPFALALATKAPIYPIFIIRLGRRRYQIRIDSPFDCPRDPLGNAHAIQVATGKWSSHLSHVIRRHWQQWYVFESVFPDS